MSKFEDFLKKELKTGIFNNEGKEPFLEGHAECFIHITARLFVEELGIDKEDIIHFLINAAHERLTHNVNYRSDPEKAAINAKMQSMIDGLRLQSNEEIRIEMEEFKKQKVATTH